MIVREEGARGSQHTPGPSTLHQGEAYALAPASRYRPRYRHSLSHSSHFAACMCCLSEGSRILSCPPHGCCFSGPPHDANHNIHRASWLCRLLASCRLHQQGNPLQSKHCLCVSVKSVSQYRRSRKRENGAAELVRAHNFSPHI